MESNTRSLSTSEGFLKDSVLDQRLSAMPRTAGLLKYSYAYIKYLYVCRVEDGRVPEGITRRMGYWKAEEFKNFTFPASEYILDGVLPDEHFNVWQLIVRITELVFSCGRNGLTPGRIT